MRRIVRSFVPRLKRSYQKYGAVGTVLRCFLIPLYLIRDLVELWKLRHGSRQADPFDGDFGVDTQERVELSALDIDSPNWICGVAYWPTPVHTIRDVFRSLPGNLGDYVLVDFGCGKGRVLLVASEFPFKRIIGVEFSAQLMAIAEKNLQLFKGVCANRERVHLALQDAASFEIPSDPLICYFFNPFNESVMTQVIQNIVNSFKQNPRQVYVVYVTPTYGDMFASAGFRKSFAKKAYAVYELSAHDLPSSGLI